MLYEGKGVRVKEEGSMIWNGWREEVWMVEGVEQLGSELHTHAVLEFPVLVDRGVPVLVTRATQI